MPQAAGEAGWWNEKILQAVSSIPTLGRLVGPYSQRRPLTESHHVRKWQLPVEG